MFKATIAANRFPSFLFAACCATLWCGPASAANEGLSDTFYGQGTGGVLGTGYQGSANAFFGTGAGGVDTTGTANAFFGWDAGGDNTTGINNAFFGSGAGNSNTSGNYNAFFGLGAGDANTVGAQNTFLGAFAGGNNVNGQTNVFVGRSAGQNNTSASDNTFVGFSTGLRNETGFGNAFFGSNAGFSNLGGSGNSFFGTFAGYQNASGGNNTFVGISAGNLNVGGSQNAFFGAAAGSSSTSGSSNVFIGSTAGSDNDTGNFNTFVGRSSGDSNVSGSRNTFVGAAARGQDSVLNNATAVGYNAQTSLSNSLVLGSTPEGDPGDPYVSVGIGTASPTFPLHIRRNDTTENLLRLEQSSATLKDRALMLLSNKGGTRFQFDNTATGNSWRFQAGTGGANNFEITDVDAGTGVIELRLTEVGNLIIAGTLTQNSNVHDKTGIVPVNGDALLSKVQALPISEWRYRNDAETPHVGPMAQDFYAAFKLGSDETKIAPGDMAGVALAAIKAQQAEIEELRAQVKLLATVLAERDASARPGKVRTAAP